jgi:putative redox protein
MRAVVRWQDKVCFEVESGSGHKLLVDGAPDHGGENRGPRPMELVLMGVGSCSSFDVVHILKKARQQVTDCRCELSAKRAEDQVPAVFTEIHLHFVVTGHDLKAAQVQKAVALAVEKYCSAATMLERGGVEISHSHEVLEKA